MLAQVPHYGNIDEAVVQLEYKEMPEEITLDASDKRWWDYHEFVNSTEAGYRSVLVILLCAFGPGFLEQQR